MAYVKQEWKDEVLNGPEQYNLTAPGTNIDEATIALSTPITQAGTPITAERMNHIEDGIAGITPASIGAMAERPVIIEMGGAPWTGGVIDFHFGNTAEDFTVRLAEFTPGHLQVKSKTPGTCIFSIDGFISSININDSGWIEMGLTNGWTRITNGLARFRKYNSVVYVVGQLYGGAATSPAFIQLPSGFRPHVRTEFICTRDDNTTICGVAGSDGILWFTTTAYGNMMHFSGSWIGEV